jgi:outer membrane protein assembly factor BamB
MKTIEKTTEPTLQKPLRLWPGVVFVILQFLIRFGLPVILPDAIAVAMLGDVVFGLAIVVWWGFFSRAPGLERWSAVVLMISALTFTSQIIDKSIGTAMMGMMFVIYSIPVLCLAFVVWAVVSQNLSVGLRRVTMVATILLASGVWGVLRTDGMDGEGHQSITWRWAKSSEDRLLANSDDALTKMPMDAAAMAKEAEWPGFRGINRDGIIHGVKIRTDWTTSPPVEMWRRSVGPGCSSFAIHGSLLFTQEQRGENEMVSCYNLKNEKPIWRHQDKARFWDSHTGAGPRSTPTLYKGRVYTLGATGILNVLDERDGKVIWTLEAAKAAKVKIPGWAYTGSPLVIDSVVVVAISGKLIAYDLVTGKERWHGADGGESYSSPHLMTIDGVRQILFMNKSFVTSYLPNDGKELWKIQMTGPPILQPAMVNESDILIGNVSETGSKGMQRITVKKGSVGWTAKVSWYSNRLRPYFNDFVIHKGNVYGFDGVSLCCIDIEKGNRKWKGGNYGGGELLLLADQDLLIVMSEQGDIALVNATSDQFKELARIPAIKGRTWNHPVLAGDLLLLRNSQEMVAYRLQLAGS